MNWIGTRTLLIVAAIALSTVPALAGDSTRWAGPDQHWTPLWGRPWGQPWACAYFESANRCNALWLPHAGHCRCMGMEPLGKDLSEFYGPHYRPIPVEQ